MAITNVRVAPFIGEVFTITSVWWENPRNHRGLDITTSVHSNLYSMCDGEVVFSGAQTDAQGNLTGYGYYIIIKDSTNGMGFLYAHMDSQSPKRVGDSVRLNEFVGVEGTTGDSTGIHLHLEMQDISQHSWVYGAPKSYYTNPAVYMGIPNVEGEQGIYYGYVPPTPTIRKKKFPWVLYARNLRGDRQNEYRRNNNFN